MPTVKDILNIISDFAPIDKCAVWDNVGLIFGNENQKIGNVFLSLDADSAALEKAKKISADLIVTHHPPYFNDSDDELDMAVKEKLFNEIKKYNIPIISMHTNLDACDGGINDVLSSVIGIKNPQKFLCEDNIFLGRYGDINTSVKADFAKKLKSVLKTPYIRFVAPNNKIQKVAVVSGSGASGLYEAKKLGCDTLVTGDAKYSAFKNALEMGINLFDCGHFETEKIILPYLEKLIKNKLIIKTVISDQKTFINYI